MYTLYVIVAFIVVCVVIYIVWLEIRGQRLWVLSQHSYEGFPLFLRHVERLPFPSRRAELPSLAIITHTFAMRLANGLPDPDYNDTLVDFDLTLIDAMKDDGVGSPVLIETFGGKRIYYYYVTDEVAAQIRFWAIRRRFTEEELAFECRPDPEWGFIHSYAKDYFPELIF